MGGKGNLGTCEQFCGPGEETAGVSRSSMEQWTWPGPSGTPVVMAKSMGLISEVTRSDCALCGATGWSDPYRKWTVQVAGVDRGRGVAIK